MKIWSYFNVLGSALLLILSLSSDLISLSGEPLVMLVLLLFSAGGIAFGLKQIRSKKVTIIAQELSGTLDSSSDSRLNNKSVGFKVLAVLHGTLSLLLGTILIIAFKRMMAQLEIAFLFNDPSIKQIFQITMVALIAFAFNLSVFSFISGFRRS